MFNRQLRTKNTNKLKKKNILGQFLRIAPRHVPRVRVTPIPSKHQQAMNVPQSMIELPNQWSINSPLWKRGVLHRMGLGCWVRRSPKRFFTVTLCRENLSSGEKRAGWAELVGWPNKSTFCWDKQRGGWGQRLIKVMVWTEHWQVSHTIKSNNISMVAVLPHKIWEQWGACNTLTFP